jgi:hypothetical protein
MPIHRLNMRAMGTVFSPADVSHLLIYPNGAVHTRLVLEKRYMKMGLSKRYHSMM